jgi:hypothetical protein
LRSLFWLVRIWEVLLVAGFLISLGVIRAKTGEVERLRQEIQSRARMPALPRSVRETPRGGEAPVEVARPSVPVPDKRPEVQGQIRALEASLQDLSNREQQLVEAFRGPLGSMAGRPSVGKWEIPALQARVLDPLVPAKERVEALGELRETGRSSLLPEIVTSMVVLLNTSPEADVRAGICRYLRGAAGDPWRDGLLQRVRFDDSAAVREKAVECLGEMSHDPVVLATLEEVVAWDSSDQVRARARRVLTGTR